MKVFFFFVNNIFRNYQKKHDILFLVQKKLYKRNSMVCQSNSSFIGNIIILQNFEIAATYVYNHTIQGSTSSTSQSNYCVCMVYLVIKTYLLLVDIEFD